MKLKEWELESVLMYLWTLELQLKDLNLEEEDYGKVQNAISNFSNSKDQETIELID